jgi:hypothetical protein
MSLAWRAGFQAELALCTGAALRRDAACLAACRSSGGSSAFMLRRARPVESGTRKTEQLYQHSQNPTKSDALQTWTAWSGDVAWWEGWRGEGCRGEGWRGVRSAGCGACAVALRGRGGTRWYGFATLCQQWPSQLALASSHSPPIHYLFTQRGNVTSRCGVTPVSANSQTASGKANRISVG